MAEIFDPVSEALKLETTVKTFIDHSGHRSNPVEDSEIASTAQRQLDDQLSELWKNPEHLAAVGKQLEKINKDIWSSLPYADIEAVDGKITRLEFKGSAWDPSSYGRGFRAYMGERKLDTYGW